jgi:hypothetical protein
MDGPGDEGTRARTVGRRFPEACGTTLAGKRLCLPDDVAGAPAVLLVAYQRVTQEDIDAWMAFLHREAPHLAVYEVPTIPAPAYRLWSGWIDAGMRKGVPQELWSNVLTLYAEGAPVRDFLGNADKYSADVVLLDAGGVVRWFDDSGFDRDKGGDLLHTLRALEAESA